ncbi:MAG: NAD(P)H-hydrate dehydratase [Gemmatimonadota bacterium]
MPSPTASQARELDRRTMDDMGVPSSVLMENAGRAAAQVIQGAYPSGPIAVLVGPGNNGGDGLVVARTLAAWGRVVTVVHLGSELPAAHLLHGWEGRVRVMPATSSEDQVNPKLASVVEGAGVVVDGLLGTGVKGAPRGDVALVLELVDEIRRGQGVVALDLPSGVDATSGAVPGSVLRASLTVSFGWPKLGTLLHPGAGFAGERMAVEIGYPPEVAQWPGPDGGQLALVITSEWAATRLPPPRPSHAHKKSVGTLALVAGSPGMAGAAILAGRAALRSGVGLLKLCAPGEIRDVLQQSLPEAIFVDRDDTEALVGAVADVQAVAMGPGMGLDGTARRALDRILDLRAGAMVTEGESSSPLLLDADALTLLARSHGEAQGKHPGRKHPGLGGGVLLTPHPGEMGRLLEETSSHVQQDRMAALTRGLERWGCTIALKGNPSLVGTPAGAMHVAPTGGPHLAVAGMGDVLTGVTGALMARGLSPLDAAGVALVASGAAARDAGVSPGLLPGDLPLHLPAVLADLAHPPPLPFPFATLHLRPE